MDEDMLREAMAMERRRPHDEEKARDEQQGDRCVCGRLKSEHTPTKGCVELAMSDEQQSENHYEYIDGRAVARVAGPPDEQQGVLWEGDINDVAGHFTLDYLGMWHMMREDRPSAGNPWVTPDRVAVAVATAHLARLLRASKQALAAGRDEQRRCGDEAVRQIGEANAATHAAMASQRAAEAERDEARREVERLREEMRDCDACAGTGTPASGLPCMCGGTGRARDAVSYLRPELHRERAAKVALADAAREIIPESFIEGYLAALDSYHDSNASAQRAWDESEAKRSRDAALRAATGEAAPRPDVEFPMITDDRNCQDPPNKERA